MFETVLKKEEEQNVSQGGLLYRRVGECLVFFEVGEGSECTRGVLRDGKEVVLLSAVSVVEM